MDTNHAEQNAKCWADSIAQMVAALECDYDRLAELRDEREAVDTPTTQAGFATFDASPEGDELRELESAATIDGDVMENAEAARQRIEESPLSVLVRSGWVSVGEEMQAAEFEILLSTGGPALRIMGELDEHKQPTRAWLEYQDWGTGWTQYFKVEQSTLLTFCQQFYFGE